MTRLVGYFLGVEVRHKTELDALIAARQEWLMDPDNENTPRQGCPRVPKSTPAGYETNWYFIQSRLQTRFIGRDFLIEAFQYPTRNFGFEYIVKLIDEGLERLDRDVCEFSSLVYNDKRDLLEIFKGAVEKFRADRHLNQIFRSRRDAQSPKDYAKEAMIELMRNSIQMDPIICEERADGLDSESISDSENDDPTNDYIDKIVTIWFGGFESYQQLRSNEKKEAFFIKSMRNIMTEMKPDTDITTQSPENQLLFTQKEMVEVWQKLISRIDSKIKQGKSSLPQRYLKCCLRFAELGFQTMTATKTTLELERNGFKNCYV